MEAIKKFVVIGPESTGKSTLCSQLAVHYNTSWVPEYAREYLETNGMNYSYDDLLVIARGQIKSEEALSLGVTGNHGTKNELPLLFVDTDMYVMKVWCEYVFNKCHNWILNRIAERHYDGYLLCNTDLPWVKDNLREYPDEGPRNRLFHFYKDLMVSQPVPWTIIEGDYTQRFETAVRFIEKEISGQASF